LAIFDEFFELIFNEKICAKQMFFVEKAENEIMHITAKLTKITEWYKVVKNFLNRLKDIAHQYFRQAASR